MTFVALSGPPLPIKTWNCVNAWKHWMVEIMQRNISVGVNSGRLTYRKAVHPFVPSKRPLSYSSCGMACKPARIIMKLKRRDVNTVIKATAASAVLALFSRLSGCNCNTSTSHLVTLMFGAYISDQMTPALATEIATLLVKMVRKTPIAFTLAVASTARAREVIILSGTTIKLNSTVVRILCRYSSRPLLSKFRMRAKYFTSLKWEGAPVGVVT